MLSEALKQLSRNSWHWVQYSAFGGVTTAKVWMGHHHDLYAHETLPDLVARSLSYMI